jgi:hypothetical protein
MKYKNMKHDYFLESANISYNEQGFVAGVELEFRLPGTAAWLYDKDK